MHELADESSVAPPKRLPAGETARLRLPAFGASRFRFVRAARTSCEVRQTMMSRSLLAEALCL